MNDYDELPSDLLEQLRSLDPVHAAAPTPVAELRAQAAVLVESPRPNRNRWAPLAVAACVALLAALAVVLKPGSTHSPAPRELGAAQQTIPEQYRSIARRINPLSADMTIRCEGIDIPVAALAAPGDAQDGGSASSQKLRAYLANRPSLQGKDWLLLYASTQRLVFAARVGALGMSTTLFLPTHGRSYREDCTDPIAQLVAGPGEVAVPFQVTHVNGDRITVDWQTGECSASGPPDLSFDHFATRQSAGSVHLLLITKPRAPDAGLPSGPSSPARVCAGVGLVMTTTVTLDQPLGQRLLYDDAVVPAHRRR